MLDKVFSMNCEVCGQKATYIGKYTLCSTHLASYESYSKNRVNFYRYKRKLDSIKYEFRHVLKKKSYLGTLDSNLLPKSRKNVVDLDAYKEFKSSITRSDKTWEDNIRSRQTKKDDYGNTYTTYKDKRGVERVMPEIPKQLKQKATYGKKKV